MIGIGSQITSKKWIRFLPIDNGCRCDGLTSFNQSLCPGPFWDGLGHCVNVSGGRQQVWSLIYTPS